MALNIISTRMAITFCLKSRYLSTVQIHISISVWTFSRHPNLTCPKVKLLISPKTALSSPFLFHFIVTPFTLLPHHKVSSLTLNIQSLGNHISLKFKINPVSNHFSGLHCYNPRHSHNCLFPESLKKISQFIFIPLQVSLHETINMKYLNMEVQS